MTLLESLKRRIIADSVREAKERNVKLIANSEKFIWGNLLYVSI